MGIPVFILGESGSGKSSSLRNFEPDEVGIINVAGKPLPFRKKLPSVRTANYQEVMNILAKAKAPVCVIDDAQYLMTFDMFGRAREKGYEKFTDMALSFYNLIRFVESGLPLDRTVYFMMHTEMGDDGKIRAKTTGKMLKERLTLEGLVSIVLMTEVTKDGYFFITQSDGTNVCKSPMDMFPYRIDNDLRTVDQAIREYWDLTPLSAKEESSDGTDH